jgi:hypothetical protein
MKSIVIKSNHGNHRSHSRKWTVLAEFETIEEAQDYLQFLFMEINPDEEVVEEMDMFEYDLYYYYLVTEEDYFNGFFDGGHRGYANADIEAAFADYIEPNFNY